MQALLEDIDPCIHALVVDDDDVDRERLTRMLRRCQQPITITEAASKSSALIVLRERRVRFSFIFLDFKLDDGDGRELLPDIWEIVGFDCAVVAVTGGGSEKAAVDAIKLGIHDYLAKKELSVERLAGVLDEGLKWIRVQAKLREAESELLHKSLHDALTDLPNRHVFFDRLEQSCISHRRKSDPFAVVMVDLDRFKEVNDLFGHIAGDGLLVEVARRLRSCVREADTVARLGGDEFAAILHGVHSLDVALAMGSKLVDRLEQRYAQGGDMLEVGASVGIALCPQHGNDSQTLLSRADNAMYRAKRGLDRAVIYDPLEPHSSNFMDRMVLLGELELALERGDICWYWQPKINLVNRRVLGFEALARWQHPKYGPVEPHVFVSLVEQSPLLPAFTLKTIESVLGQFSKIQADMADCTISINISARVLEQADFVELLMDRIERLHVPPTRLMLELTETALITNPVQAKRVIDSLVRQGVELSIDDFGAGFTSFGYLRDFVVHEIKIDKSYITHLGRNVFDMSLVRSLVVFCDALNIRLVAEGVESDECWAGLVALGCLCGQGYGISRPMPFEALPGWLRKWQSHGSPAADGLVGPAGP